MRMSEKCCNNNNSDNPLTSRRTDGGKKGTIKIIRIDEDHKFIYTMYGLNDGPRNQGRWKFAAH